MEQSIRRFQEMLDASGLDGAWIAAPEELSSTNLRYLSGFTGSSAHLLVTRTASYLITDFRYWDQASSECPQCEIIRSKKSVSEIVAGLVIDHRLRYLGFETEKVPVAMWKNWSAEVPVVWKPLDKMVEKLRLIKYPAEIEAIRAAARIAGESLMEVLGSVVGRKELDVALDLELAMRRRGAESLGFSTIIGSGERGALPHAHPTDRVIQAGELVTVDFGAQVNGYKSDETLTFATGPVSEELKTIWNIVAKAQAAGIAAVKPGATSRDVDTAVRTIIGDAGYGERFGHGTGHGVGLDIHENPFASQNPQQEQVLEVGMTITVEPGIYIPGLGGARLEDTLVITENGAERLTIVPKSFQIIS
ncbi:MAG: Xaa-Pro dipeptidase [Sulfobacillus acidophilus]|uniref:Xaa-Pro dipeptidase n=1 Tax=Sulfobacillus acidophilus TaxID=53633 RepID=A0A2T2WL42_9FIRM|nr:MAG: Xaa-Pro dipeptidase [Sulfobacillus acidophilus]